MSNPAEPDSPKSNDSPSVEFLDPATDMFESEEDTPPMSTTKSASSSLSLAFWPVLASGLAVKRKPDMDSWLDLIQTLDGRDKVTKLLQYTARLLAWYYGANGERWATLKASLVRSRKAFRLGRTLIELRRLQTQHVWKNVFSKELDSATSLARVLVDQFATTVRYLGLAGFWALDNTAFLAASGVWDNYRTDSGSRSATRKALQTKASVWANRSYFSSAVAGFWINLEALRKFRRDIGDKNVVDASERQRIQAKYFGLCLNLLKSVCDMLVFSNNPGLEFWKRFYGHRLHEAVHCVCGLTSASVVLYKNYPSA